MNKYEEFIKWSEKSGSQLTSEQSQAAKNLLSSFIFDFRVGGGKDFFIGVGTGKTFLITQLKKWDDSLYGK